MADKSPNKPSAKKPGMSLKEKRAAKKAKGAGGSLSNPTSGLRLPKTGH
ncbi:MAG TPA: hypothetical protein VGH66_06345 [Acidimicrobiales bacterium]|jgi:hypothetical protein